MVSRAFDFTPEVGRMYERHGRVFTCVGVRPYKRRDGRQTQIADWSTICSVCDKELRTTSGMEWASMHYFHSECLKIHSARKAKITADQRVDEKWVDIRIIYAAMQKLKPGLQLSIAMNAPRRMYLPALLKDVHEHISAFTNAEIEAVVRQCLELKVMERYVVGRYKKNYNPVFGLRFVGANASETEKLLRSKDLLDGPEPLVYAAPAGASLGVFE